MHATALGLTARFVCLQVVERFELRDKLREDLKKKDELEKTYQQQEDQAQALAQAVVDGAEATNLDEEDVKIGDEEAAGGWGVMASGASRCSLALYAAALTPYQVCYGIGAC